MEIVDIIGPVGMILSFVINLVIFAKNFPKISDFFRYWIRRQALRRLLGSNNVVCHIPSRKPDGIHKDRIQDLVAMEDYKAYECFRHILEENKFNVFLEYIPTSGNIGLVPDKANIVICGPKNSYKIQELFNSLPGLRSINATNYKGNETRYFLETKNNTERWSPMDRDPPKNEDFAFFGKLTFYSGETQQKFISVGGIHAIGSLGVAHFLNDKKTLLIC